MGKITRLRSGALSIVFGLCFGVACGEDTGPDGGSSGTGAGSAGAGRGGTGGSANAGRGGSTGGKAGTSSGGASSGAGGSVQGGSSGASKGGAGSGGAGTAGGTPEGGSDTGGAGEDGQGGAGNAAGSAGTDAAGAAGAPPRLDSFRIAVLGSSTAEGTGASNGNGWVDLLRDALADIVTGDFDLENLAHGGYTALDIVPGSNEDGNIDDAIDVEPNLILISIAGSNDLDIDSTEEEFIERLTAARDAALEAGIPVFFVSTAPKDLGDDDRQALKDWADTMREDFSSCWVPSSPPDYTPCFIDIFAPLATGSLNIRSEYNSGDGIHLNDEGHEVIFDIALDIVEPYVCSLTECE
ncbi:MAG TPA: SGNH/GDSL hydrolase family protein [Polyangiaceae bacterium]